MAVITAGHIQPPGGPAELWVTVTDDAAQTVLSYSATNGSSVAVRAIISRGGLNDFERVLAPGDSVSGNVTKQRQRPLAEYSLRLEFPA